MREGGSAIPLGEPDCRAVDATMQERWKGGKWRECPGGKAIDDKRKGDSALGETPGEKGRPLGSGCAWNGAL